MELSLEQGSPTAVPPPNLQKHRTQDTQSVCSSALISISVISVAAVKHPHAAALPRVGRLQKQEAEASGHLTATSAEGEECMHASGASS